MRAFADLQFAGTRLMVRPSSRAQSYYSIVESWQAMPPLVLHVLFRCMATIGLMAATPAWSLDNQAQYQACMTLLDRDPAGALDSAVEWERQGGGDAARHCKALALIRTGEVEDGGLKALITCWWSEE